ncbi:hypothetical protein KP509_36G009200 [Ceratopteris richardii]|uniref:Thioredoxin domain-containing protein n=1 Tax=Ceratopteris richardii TaxID=49495 RepID=A0A8T2QAN1_CERRI|nr:hypothetical protein KP509_36G009200 [Ceratopteris richardii]KAH7280686.1 hypothetical protein KP509_36G009200 [Ceratopteris richardii]
MTSEVLPIGSRAPYFELPEPATGNTWRLDNFSDKQALLVMFICNHCPYVVHLKKAFTDFAKDYLSKGLGIVAISSNSIKSHPQDGPQFMAADAKQYGYPFPYVYDESQSVAKAYGAVCTPDLFLFKKVADGFVLVYHGQFDDSRPRNGQPVTGKDMRAAVDCVLSGNEITFPPKPCVGCSIKWA